jgi:DHA2 family lincomycin resistance protein-like MFS transporter
VDVLSVILSAFGFAGLVYGLSSLGEAAAGHATAPVWIPLTVGVVGLTLFVLRQLRLQKTDRALLDLRTFKSPGYTISVSLMAVMTIALFGVIILLPIYMQRVLNFAPLAVGLLLLPGGLLMGFLGPVVGRLYDRFGPRPLAVPGAAAVSLALWTMTLFNEQTTFAMLLVTNLVMYAGFAFMFTPLFTSALGSLKPHLYSYGSATLATIQQVGGAAGTALFVALYTVQSVALSTAGAPDPVALAGGVHVAFLCGAIISLIGVAGAFFVPKPVSEFAPTH